MSVNNNTVGTTEITPVEIEVTKSMKQESRDFGRGRLKTAEEKMIVSRYAYLIDEVIGSFEDGLDHDEWYGAAAVALCEAVISGCSDSGSIRERMIWALYDELARREEHGDMYDVLTKVGTIR